MVGDTLGKYRLLKLLARGGMGEVYLARQEGLKGFSKLVVVKRVLDHLAEDRTFSEMFVTEARLSALLTHPNIVQVFDLGEEAGGLYLAMEYVHGQSLRKIGQALNKRGQTMPPDLAARITQQALNGLAYAHRATGEDGQPLMLVHRDVSPDNVLVGYDGGVKMTDFGIAKFASSPHHTQTGVVKGKIAYMPPEQLRAEPLDARADVYAMGVVLYELLAGKRPFVGQTDTTVMLAIVQEEPKRFHEHGVAIDPALERIVFKALQKSPGTRFPSAGAMAEALESYAHTVRGSMEQSAIHHLLVDLFGEESAKQPTTSNIDRMTVPDLPAQPVDEVATTRNPALATAAHPSALQTAETPEERSPSWKVWALALGLLTLAGAGGAWVAASGRTPPGPPPVAVGEVVPAVRAPAAEPQPQRPTEPAPAPTPVEARAPVDPPVAAAAPAPVVPRSGRVEIDVVPWGEVFLGKRSLGITPMDAVTLPTGTQLLTVKNPDLKIEKKVKVLVSPGGLAHVRVNLME